MNGMPTVNSKNHTGHRAGALLLLLLLFLCASQTVSAAPSLAKKKLSLQAGNVYVLKLKNDGAQKVAWSSSGKSLVKIAYADQNCAVLRALKPGTAKVTAAVSGKKVSCKVTVKKAAAFPTKKTVLEGDSFSLQCGGKKKYAWQASGTGLQFISMSKDGRKGKFMALSEGTAKVVAKSGSARKTCRVKVLSLTSLREAAAAPVYTYELTLDRGLLTMYEGDTQTVTVHTSSTDPSATLSIECDQTDQASFAFNGNGQLIVKAKAPGTVTAKVRLGTAIETLYVVIRKNVEDYDKNVKGINHRGYKRIAPENTLPAFTLSRRKGFAYVETDVSFTKDGVAVLLHDETINRTARNADGSRIAQTLPISELSYAQASAYDFGIWKGADYAGTKIPRFEEFILLCRNISLHPYIELKSYTTYTPGQIQNLVDIVRKYGMENKVTWISFNPNYLSAVSGRHAGARLGYLTETVSAAAVETVIALRNGANDVFMDSGSWSAREVTRCYEAHIPLEVWTINDAGVMRKLDPYITGVTSDVLRYGEVLYEGVMG